MDMDKHVVHATAADDEPGTDNTDMSLQEHSYEVEEARLQQERLDFLRLTKLREDEDAAMAHRLHQEEMLHLERQKFLQEMRDEEFARQLYEQDNPTATGNDYTVSPGAAVAACDRSESLPISPPPYSLHDTSQHRRPLVTPPPCYMQQDELLAQALQEEESESGTWRPPSSSTAALTTASPAWQDAHLARIMQNSEQISALRRNNSTPCAQQFTATSLVFPLPMMSGTTMMSNGQAGQPQPQRSYSFTESYEVERSESNGYDVLPADDETLPPRRRRKSRKASCRQQ